MRYKAKDFSTQKEYVFHAVKNIRGGVTRQELSRLLDLGINAVCGRVKELENEGRVKVSGYRECTVTGNTVQTLVATK